MIPSLTQIVALVRTKKKTKHAKNDQGERKKGTSEELSS